MSVTIKDVAQKAGVAPSTVTRVIHDHPSISDKTKQRVKEAMVALNYYPNLNARSLVNRTSNVVGLVLPENSDSFYQNPFFPTVLRGISNEAARAGYSLLIMTGATSTDRLRNVELMVQGGRVDGLIFLYSLNDDPIIKRADDLTIPYVVIGKSDAVYTHFVDNDNVKSAFDATEYFINKGYTRIGFVGGNVELGFIRERLIGYQEALMQHNIETVPEYQFHAESFVPEEGERLAAQFQRTPLQAVVVADQLVARGIKQYYHKTSQQAVEVMAFKPYVSESIQEAYININAQTLGEVAFSMWLEIKQQTSNASRRYIHELVMHELVVPI